MCGMLVLSPVLLGDYSSPLTIPGLGVEMADLGTSNLPCSVLHPLPLWHQPWQFQRHGALPVLLVILRAPQLNAGA